MAVYNNDSPSYCCLTIRRHEEGVGDEAMPTQHDYVVGGGRLVEDFAALPNTAID